MASRDDDKSNYEDFIRYCSVTPNHNYFTAFKYLKPFVQDVFLTPMLQPLVERIYLLVFTPEEVILKRVATGLGVDAFTPEAYEQKLIRINIREIKDFKVEEEKELSVLVGYWLSFKYNNKNFYFKIPETEGMFAGSDNHFQSNFHRVWEQDFFGLIK